MHRNSENNIRCSILIRIELISLLYSHIDNGNKKNTIQ